MLVPAVHMYDVGCMIYTCKCSPEWNCYVKLFYNKSHQQEKHTHKLNKIENLYINNNFIQHAINNVKTMKTWIYLIFPFCMKVMAHQRVFP